MQSLMRSNPATRLGRAQLDYRLFVKHGQVRSGNGSAWPASARRWMAMVGQPSPAHAMHTANGMYTKCFPALIKLDVQDGCVS